MWKRQLPPSENQTLQPLQSQQCSDHPPTSDHRAVWSSMLFGGCWFWRSANGRADLWRLTMFTGFGQGFGCSEMENHRGRFYQHMVGPTIWLAGETGWADLVGLTCC
eukprot:EG_transcript_29938